MSSTVVQSFVQVGDFFDDFLVDLDAPQVNVGLQELVVVVQQHRRVVHRRESDRRDPNAADVPRVSATGEHEKARLQAAENRYKKRLNY